MALSINGKIAEIVDGASLFDHAERVGVSVPTSCNKQGKCRECIVEVTEGVEFLSGRTPEEKHLEKKFRLSCRAHVGQASGLPSIVCHTMRRGHMQIEVAGQAGGLPHRYRPAICSMCSG